MSRRIVRSVTPYVSPSLAVLVKRPASIVFRTFHWRMTSAFLIAGSWGANSSRFALYSARPPRRSDAGSRPQARRRDRRLLSTLPPAAEPRRHQSLRRPGRVGDLPDVPQHARLPPRAGPRQAQEREKGRQEVADRAGAGLDAEA